METMYTPSPIERLPIEILRHIFNLFVIIDNSPWWLTLVNRHWRAVALDSCILWTKIAIQDDDFFTELWRTPNCESVYSIGALTVCCNGPQLKDALSRAGRAPVKLYVALYDPFDSDLWALSAKSCYDLRIESASMSGNLQGTDSLISKLFTVSSLANMKCLTLHHSQTMSPLLSRRLDECAVKLRRLEIWVDFWGGAPRVDEGLPSRVENLVLTGPGSFNIVSWTHLVSLEVMATTWPDCGTPMIELTQLKRLKIRGNPRHLHHLRLPVLHSLILVEKSSNCAHMRETCIPTICLPKLYTLETVTQHVKWINALEMPSLHNLEIITFQKVRTESNPGILKLSAPQVNRVKVDVAIPEEFGSETLATMASVQHLRFESCGPAGPWENILEMLFADRVLPCPHLRSLEFGTSRRHDSALDDRIREIIRIAKTSSRFPLEYIDVDWDDAGVIRYA
ncbi:hypothetical protein PIIN_02301 [Serendipita indica DSM 11827]|uniref:F-box domain-containing protein n=1 Tax=Serendipita indica (strain DSM 11827) TaxID=1109443 RepID=G4TAS8_SERID|nr:hypothetical protein PIIN_02301 [Serendipita indica DSM 11827]